NGHGMKDFQVGVHMHSFVGDDSGSVADKYYPIYAAQMNGRGASRDWPPYQRQQYDVGGSSHGHQVVGDVIRCVEKILHIIEVFGLTPFSAHMDVGSPDHTDMMKAIELYGKKIVPKVKDALRK